MDGVAATSELAGDFTWVGIRGRDGVEQPTDPLLLRLRRVEHLHRLYRLDGAVSVRARLRGVRLEDRFRF